MIDIQKEVRNVALALGYRISNPARITRFWHPNGNIVQANLRDLNNEKAARKKIKQLVKYSGSILPVDSPLAPRRFPGILRRNLSREESFTARTVLRIRLQRTDAALDAEFNGPTSDRHLGTLLDTRNTLRREEKRLGVIIHDYNFFGDRID